jgi:hypothetical protein
VSDVGRYRRAYPRLFRHPAFKALTPTAQRLVAYVLWGPQSSRIGLFYFSTAVAAEDLDVGLDTLRKALGELCVSFGWMHDADARVLYIPSWWRWNPPDHEKVLQGNLKDLSELPPCALVDAFARNLEYLKPELHETFVEACRRRLPKAPPSQYQDQNQKKKQKQEHALRAVGSEENDASNSVPSDKLLRLADTSIQLNGQQADLETLIDGVFWFNQQDNGPEIKRNAVVQALNMQLSRSR